MMALIDAAASRRLWPESSGLLALAAWWPGAVQAIPAARSSLPLSSLTPGPSSVDPRPGPVGRAPRPW